MSFENKSDILLANNSSKAIIVQLYFIEGNTFE